MFTYTENLVRFLHGCLGNVKQLDGTISGRRRKDLFFGMKLQMGHLFRMIVQCPNDRMSNLIAARWIDFFRCRFGQHSVNIEDLE